ncbi:MAG: AAA family ATPase [Pseudomonadota bacterium]
MYNTFFNFEREPFSLTPDPRFLYLGAGHQEALEHMLYGIESRKGFVLIAGRVGAGKTTLTRLLLEKLDERTHRALIFNTFLNEVELLRAINRQFGLPADGFSRESLVDDLNRFLLEIHQKGENAVLILDEAQNLSVAVLEQIRMLSNLETDNRKLIQILLVGQPELTRTLARPDLSQLSQRITVRCHLPALGLEETIRYIHHRISAAGPQATISFHPGTYRLLHRFSGGTPRLINALCDRALLVAYTGGERLIKPAHVKQAQVELTSGALAESRWSFIRRFGPGIIAAAALAFLAAIAILLAWDSRP